MKRRFLSEEESQRKADIEDDIASVLVADEAVRALAVRVRTDRDLDLIEQCRGALATIYRRRLADQRAYYPNVLPPQEDDSPAPRVRDDWDDGKCIRTADHALRVLAVSEPRSTVELKEIRRGRRALARIAARLKA